ncbi:MAG TPA: alpha/beta hydrolase [Methylomirabilota bacterium]|nr:alpha/beta hydrolase [Methylomirabilota bacterium]
MRGVRTIAAVALLAAGCRETIERSLIYFPVAELIATPADLGLAFRDLWFQTEDGIRLHGWYIPGRSPLTLVWFHGNAGNISHRLENIHLFHDRLGVGVFIFDYRGYGKSQGRPSEEGLYRDARAALTAMSKETGQHARDLIYFGRSLGAALAVEMALHHPPRALVLEAPFLSVQAMAHRTLPGAGYLLQHRYDSGEKLPRVTIPVFILHGDRDETVPFSHGRRLFEIANEPKAFYTIAGADHNNTYHVGGDDYWNAWARWLTTLPDSSPNR